MTALSDYFYASNHMMPMGSGHHPLQEMMLAQQMQQAQMQPQQNVPQNVPRGTPVNQQADVSNKFRNDENEVRNPLSEGSLAAYKAIKQQSQWDSGDSDRAMGLALSHIAAGLANPANTTTLGAINAGMPGALQSYMNERQMVEQRNQQLLGQLHAQEQEEKRRREEMMMRERHHQEKLNTGHGSNPYYGIPELGKLLRQKYEIEQGYLPGSNGNVPLSEKEKEEALRLNELAILKSGSDSATRQRALFSENLLQTFDNTNLNDLVRYSGPMGQLELKKQQALDLDGQSSEEYKRFQESLTALKLEAKELRQSLGSSISESESQALNELTNPIGWGTSPEVAKRKLMKVRTILDKHAKTYKNALTSSKPYHYNRSQKHVQNLTTSDERIQEAINRGFSPEEIDMYRKQSEGT